MHQLASLRPEVQGAGNLERFDYWVNTFRAFEAAADIAAKRAQLDRTVAEGLNTADPAAARARGEAALQLRLAMTREWEEMIRLLISTVSTPGELGTIVDFEQHNRLKLEFLSAHDQRIASLVRHPLPAEIAIEVAYQGAPRVIVPSPRTSAGVEEPLAIKIIVLDRGIPAAPELHWRKLGTKTFAIAKARHVARNTFVATLPAGSDDVEYFVRYAPLQGGPLDWPATAPQLNHVVIRCSE